MPFELSLEALTALASVVAIDVALAGDNAIVVGMAAAGLPAEQRRKAIVVGIAAAALLRIFFAVFTVQLLQIIGLMFAGGLLLLWVSWRLWREIRANAAAIEAQAEMALEEDPAAAILPGKSLREAIVQIVLADVSMSLDNVLAVAGAAREHAWVLVVGLALSVALMGLAATLIARLLHRFQWIAYVGLLIIFYVALRMISDGAFAIFDTAQTANLL
jgi:YjbE family integral membrane protein